ncbi:MAG: hypothetical protein QOJ40_2374 [Verrucomicrobiota bacterium]
MPINAEEIIQWIMREDSAAYAAAREAGETFPKVVERALPNLSPSSREMAAHALATNNTPDASRVLLGMTADQEPQVAASAARSLSAITKPPAAAELLAAAPRRQEPVVRGLLYRLVGHVGKPQDLQRLRAVLASEKDEEAGEDGQAAAVRLDGAPEKTAFLNRIRTATPDTAQRVCDQLRYVEQKPPIKALLPWLSNRQEVMRLGSDRAPRMARMCDLAVWTAHQMGIVFQPKPAFLDIYPQTTLDNARDALQSLPD